MTGPSIIGWKIRVLQNTHWRVASCHANVTPGIFCLIYLLCYGNALKTIVDHWAIINLIVFMKVTCLLSLSHYNINYNITHLSSTVKETHSLSSPCVLLSNDQYQVRAPLWDGLRCCPVITDRDRSEEQVIGVIFLASVCGRPTMQLDSVST